MMKLNYEVKYTPAGQAKDLACDTCKESMDVMRNQPGRAGRFSGMFPYCMTNVHDEFTCFNSDAPWHKQAVAILELIEETPSREIEKILRKELDGILSSKKPTKSHWSQY